MRTASRRRWFVVAVFFVFMLLHQSDRLLISTLTPDIMATFQITMTQMGAVSTGALIVAAICYPFGATCMTATAEPSCWRWPPSSGAPPPGSTPSRRTIGPSLSHGATTGIDDSSYPGIYSLISDYFPPEDARQGVRHPRVIDAARLPVAG